MLCVHPYTRKNLMFLITLGAVTPTNIDVLRKLRSPEHWLSSLELLFEHIPANQLQRGPKRELTVLPPKGTS